MLDRSLYKDAHEETGFSANGSARNSHYADHARLIKEIQVLSHYIHGAPTRCTASAAWGELSACNMVLGWSYWLCACGQVVLDEGIDRIPENFIALSAAAFHNHASVYDCHYASQIVR